jgi:hypothetical protein
MERRRLLECCRRRGHAVLRINLVSASGLGAGASALARVVLQIPVATARPEFTRRNIISAGGPRHDPQWRDACALTRCAFFFLEWVRHVL